MTVSRSDTPPTSDKEKTSMNLAQGTPAASLNHSRSAYLLAIALHIVLVIIHLIFVVIHFPHKHENRLSVARGTRSNTISVVIIVGLEAFIVVYLAVLIYLMQKLSFWRSVAIQQTLTALHDKHAAWSGPGAAIATLSHQIHLRTAFSSLFFVVLYMFVAAALHVTTPALMSLGTSDRPSPGIALVKSSRPDFLEGVIAPTVLSDSIPLLPALGLMQNANATAGLYGNILHDTPASVYQIGHDGLSVERSLAKEFQVPNATLFNVTCGNLAGVEQVGAGNATSWFLKTPVRNVTDGNYNPLRLFDPYAIRFIPQEYFTADQDFASQTLLLVASVNITDSEGNNGSTFAVNPPFNPLPFQNWPYTGYFPRTFDPIVIACSLVSSRTNVNIDPVSKTISRDSIDANPRKTFRLWAPWTEPTRSDDPLVQSWASIFLEASRSTIIATTCIDPLQYPDRQPQCQTNDYLTIVEKYVNDALQIRPFSADSDVTYNTSVNLHDLENVLEDLTAAVFWNEANFPATALDFASGREFELSVDVMVFDPTVLLLTINETPLGVGLCCSVGLLCIAFYLLRSPKEASLPADLNAIGLLQFIWLLGRGSDVQTKIADVARPSTDNLRAAGMTEFTLSTLALQYRKRRSDQES
ncbi:hypothetical protein MSAN_01603600 [Mycena sanguinolenta]|uniref:Transmembrane protein n=1 Tax=Mycena sanguinolenta TaxID=230812 RepID=A0A8H6Y0D6_9AGAR|nr:hypothetical protein MSAN_01603600 [Mycena sanguinolenta]